MKNDVFLQRAGQIAGVGGWRLDLATMSVEWSDQTCRILDVPLGHRPTLDDALGMYTPEAAPVISSLIEKAIADGSSWDVELRMVTVTGRFIWARSIGEAKIVDGKVVAVEGAIQDITQRKAAQAEHLEMVETTRVFYDNAPCGYYSVGPDLVFLRVNDRMLLWLGCSRDDVVGKKKPTDFMTPQSVANIEVAFPRFKETGELRELECELLPVNGKIRFVSISATAIYDAHGAFQYSRSVMYDITETVQFREQGKALALEQHAMLDNDLIGIIKLRDRKFLWANRAMHRIFGYENGTLIGLPSRTGYRDDASFVAFGEQAYPVLQAGETYRGEIEMVRQDGTPVWIEMNGMMLDAARKESMWMMADITERKERQEAVQHMAFHDALTGLPNRLLLADRITQAIATAERNQTKLAVCYLDLDGFKSVNDHYGHDAGDKLLVEVSRRLLSCVRNVDTVCRLGGDEFVLVLSDLGDLSEFDAIAHRLLAAVAEPVALVSGAFASVSASIGVSLFPDDASDQKALLRQADQAMYEAKALGKNQYVRFVKAA